jgi:hypothetical protein
MLVHLLLLPVNGGDCQMGWWCQAKLWLLLRRLLLAAPIAIVCVCATTVLVGITAAGAAGLLVMLVHFCSSAGLSSGCDLGQLLADDGNGKWENWVVV